MGKITRDTTRDLFFATLNLVKEQGHYDKAEPIMDYVLPNENEGYIREAIELSNYCFDFRATLSTGSEGIYIDCYLLGDYTENEIKKYDHSTQTVTRETKRSIGTFKTLRDDIEAMKIMGELCGALIHCAHEYIDKNISKYTPTLELTGEEESA